MAAVMKPHHPIVRIGLGTLARQAEKHHHGQSHRAPNGGKAQVCFASLVVSIGHYARTTAALDSRRSGGIMHPPPIGIDSWFSFSWTPAFAAIWRLLQEARQYFRAPRGRYL